VRISSPSPEFSTSCKCIGLLALTQITKVDHCGPSVAELRETPFSTSPNAKTVLDKQNSLCKSGWSVSHL
jgi:hypothetical protein